MGTHNVLNVLQKCGILIGEILLSEFHKYLHTLRFPLEFVNLWMVFIFQWLCVFGIFYPNGGKFPSFPSNQKMNQQLKDFAQFAGLDAEFKVNEQRVGTALSSTRKQLHEVITCHVGRGSFITNLRNLDIPMDTIEPLTHPKKAKGVVNRVYDKSTQKDAAIKLVRHLERIGDSTYRRK